jgi:DNA replication and repair protein RecF
MSVPSPSRAEGRLSRLRLFNFRNYVDLELELDPGLNVFVGENAQGKTNLLEAVATLLLTRSPRAANMAELLRWGAEEAAVDAELTRGSLSEALALRLRLRDAAVDVDPGERVRVSRSTSRDGHPISPRELLGRWPVVLFWPDDLQLVKAGPEARRRLLDVLVAQLDRSAADELLRYRRTLEQRNALLRRLQAGDGTAAGELHPFDDALVHHGASVQLARARLVRELAPLAAAALAEITDSSDTLELRYAPHSGEPSEEREVVVSALAAALRRAQREEVARGTTVVGPHRDDLDFVLNGRSARVIGSQGQQRSSVLATKIAEVRLVRERSGRMPLLLLDDVLSELDPARRERLLSALSVPEDVPQTLVTSADENVVGAHRARRFVVRSGSVVAR